MEKINKQKYLEELIDKYQDLIFSICYKFTGNYYEAEDLAQETFLSAYKALDRFDGTYEKAWLATIASNKCRDFLKSAQRREMAVTEDEFLLEVDEKSLSVEQQVEEKAVKERLYEACDSLSEPYRQRAIDYFYHEKSMAEIAKDTGSNLKTVQTQVYRAREKLRRIYGKGANL